CMSSPCGNNGSCIDFHGYFTCSCYEGFVNLQPQQCFDFNECSSASPPCQNNGTCLNTVGSFQCTCPSDYYGVRCQTYSHPCFSSPCKNGGSCYGYGDSSLDFECICQPGYKDSLCSTEENKCESYPCEPFGKCNDLGPSSYTCSCLPGFTSVYGNDTFYECKQNLSSCSPQSWCMNLPGRYQCICPPGKVGLFCEMEVLLCMSSPCGNNGSCNDIFNNYTCSCYEGFRSDGHQLCVDECSSFTPACQNNGTCVNTIGSFHCSCPANYYGLHCQIYSWVLLAICV
ncbi:hypothetical protein HELRODRAFT_72662, partial [Helobdella robusta]|uniref:EGF-like domain-containing protein n=1 Tax=Helobdella robusta TaxID=6412 RepID=T1G135_HELRO